MREGEYSTFPLYPLHEKSHNRNGKGQGKTPTIDFCFRDRYVRDLYFGAECKLLKENDRKLFDDYVNGGVRRYISGKYGVNCSEGSMIGYITFGNRGKIIGGIKGRVNKASTISNMKKAEPLNGFSDHYKSLHGRTIGCSPFGLHHLLFNFT
jgi:retron-type reverse transcriptase